MLGLVSSSVTNTDQLSASLKTDKTGVWHWNSSQRIKASILPASPVSDAPLSLWHNSVRWLMLSAFKHWGMTTKQTNKQACKSTQDSQTLRQGGYTTLKKQGSKVISNCGRFYRMMNLPVPDPKCCTHKPSITQTVCFERNSLTFWQVVYWLSCREFDEKIDSNTCVC